MLVVYRQKKSEIFVYSLKKQKNTVKIKVNHRKFIRLLIRAAKSDY